MNTKEYDIVIIGSGAAGLYSAYKISKKKDKCKILIITKNPFGESNSRYAQGGIAAAIKNNKNDTILLHIQDTLKSGAGLCDEDTVRYIIENSEKTINDLTLINAGFDRSENGEFEYTLGGGHSANRVLHSGEDATGMVMINALCKEVKNIENIDIMPRTMAVEIILSENNECSGIVVLNGKTKEHEIIISNNIILATGGCGQVYEYTTNPYGATADGLALAYLSGAEIQDIEFIQFHPTALVLNEQTKNRYLISEALRGEGAKLINNSGEEFMSRYSSKKELAPRDVVSRAILSEMKKEGKPNVFLDARKIPPDVLLKRFPSISKKCRQGGIDITKDLIPVAPAAHYMIGGIKAKPNGQTSIKGLYAIGEVASTGFHGANRLASNSLLECVVCADKLARDIEINKPANNKNLINKFIEKYSIFSNIVQDNSSHIPELKNKLKEIMWENAGIIRDEKSLTEALKQIEEIKSEIRGNIYLNISEYELRNMIIASELITKCALDRKESTGAHSRSDYPESEPIAKHSIIKKEQIK